MPQTVKSVYSHFHGHSVKFGALRPKVPIRRMFRRYLTSVSLPAPPATVDFSARALPELSQMNANDAEGCCVPAGFYHHKGVWTGNSGTLFIATPTQVLADYSSITGYVVGNPATDRGTDPVAAYQWWAANPAANGTVLAGAMGFDAVNVGSAAGQYTLKQALDLFEGVQVTLELPDAYVNPMPQAPGFTWGVAGPPNPSQGHCYLAYGYNDDGLLIDPWGGLYGLMTWDAVAMYCTSGAGGMIYILLDPDQWQDAALKAGNGLDSAQLEADFPSLSGTSSIVPVSVSPVPVPVVIPPPEPVSTMVFFGLDVTNKLASVPEGWSAYSGIFPNQATIHVEDQGFALPRGYKLTV